MRARTWFHSELHLTYSCVEGTVTPAALIYCRKLLSADPRHHPEHDHLVDLRHATDVVLNWEEAFDLGHSSIHSARRAIIAPADAIFGSARMADSWTQDARPGTLTCRSLDEARDFLDVPAQFDLEGGEPLIIDTGDD